MSNHPLAQPLDDLHYELLDSIFDPVVNVGASWPVWDYVNRTWYRHDAQRPPASAVWHSLPDVPVGIQRDHYGLVWRAEIGTIDPAPEHRVGLSIAGLHRLGERRPDARELADLLATFVGYVANWERNLLPDPRRAVSMEQPLDDLIRQLIQRGQYLRQVRPVDLLDVLQREFAQLNIQRQVNGENAKVILGAHLAAFHGVEAAAEYIARVAAHQRQQPPIASVPPLFVAQMLDYLSVALASHPAWPNRHLIAAPDLRAAGTLALDVQNDSEFRDRLSALGAVLSALQVPDIPAEFVDKQFGGTQPGSLVRLRDWLTGNLADDAARERAHESIERLRSVIALRNEGQHPSASQRKTAAAARRALGLPDLILDWGAAWNLVRARVAEACDVITREVRAT